MKEHPVTQAEADEPVVPEVAEPDPEPAEKELEEGETEVPINPGNVNDGTGIKAADFENRSCDQTPGGTAPEGQDGWVFVLPGNDAAFVSVSATFAEDGTIAGTVAEGHDGKFAYVTATAAGRRRASRR